MIPVGTLCYIRDIPPNDDPLQMNGRTCEIIGPIFTSRCVDPACRTLHAWYRCMVPRLAGLFAIAPECLVPITPPGRQTIRVKRERAKA